MENPPLINYVFYFQLCCTLFYGLILCVLAIGLNQIKTKPVQKNRPFVSVVIAARNEEKNISACLKHLSQQRYPREKYEVIVVDDHSNDATFSIVESFDDKNIKLFPLGETNGISPKKAAIHKGIEKSRGDIIITTDADCRAGSAWIETIVRHFDEKTGAVASWLYVEENNHFLSKLESLDSLALSFVGAASFGLRKPFVANGANFAYRRQVYDELNGFEGVAEYVSGDDDLLLQKIKAGHKWTCAFAPDPGAMILTTPNENMSTFFEQRFRWASKSRVYPPKIVLLEIFIYLYFCSFLLTTAAFIAGGFVNIVLLLALVLKFLLDLLFMNYAARRIQKKINPFMLFMTGWLQIVYVTIVGVWGTWGSYTWKGRRYTKGKVNV